MDLEIGKAAPEHPDDLPELLEAEVADGDVMSHEIPADHLVQEVDVASIPYLFIVAGQGGDVVGLGRDGRLARFEQARPRHAGIDTRPQGQGVEADELLDRAPVAQREPAHASPADRLPAEGRPDGPLDEQDVASRDPVPHVETNVG